MTNQKRSKSKTRGPAPEDEQPLGDGSDTSLSRGGIDKLLQKAVPESTLDAKSRRRRKKQTEEFMLDTLRRGDGLKKDEDQTLLANMYDSDDVKGEKSNKRRQRARERTDDAVQEKTQMNLAYVDETSSPGLKKKKKKATLTTERDQLEIEAASPSSTRRKKKRKNINTDQEMESESAVLPSGGDDGEPEPEAHTKTKKKMKKKKNQHALQEQSDDADRTVGAVGQTDGPALSDGTVDQTEVKKKKKKKAKAKQEEEAEPVTEAEPELEVPSQVEDIGRVIGITVHRTDKLKTDFYVSHPLIQVHIIDLDTGNPLKKQHKDRHVSSYYEDSNLDFILPIMTFPFHFKTHKCIVPVWEETLVFNENYNFILQKKPNVIIFFELLDFFSMNTACQRYNQEKQDGGWHRIAWAFLKVVGATGSPNTGRKVRLQLYHVPLNFKVKGKQNVVYSWYNAGTAYRVPYPSTLYVTVKGLLLPEALDPACRSLFATQAEQGKISYDQMQRDFEMGRNLRRERNNLHEEPALWSRLQGQVCKVPNSLHFTLPVSRKGCFAISFSPDGRSLACACHDTDGYPIIIYNIPEGTMKGQMLGHYGIIYDLNWSHDNMFLLSASSDGTARVWHGHTISQTPAKLLPHPAYVYTARFHVRVQKVVVTGSYDRVIRVWSLQGDAEHAELIQELEGHLGFVNALSFDREGGLLYSGDSQGHILIWNVYCTDKPSKKGMLKDWTRNGEIKETEIEGTTINSMSLHPNGRRLLVHCRDNIIRMIDLRLSATMQRYHGALNFREQIRSTISPCGTFVLSGSEDCAAYIWNTEAGDRVASYTELGYKSTVTDVAFHPHEHMVAFCSYGENHPVLVYKYDHAVAQRDAGFETPVKMFTHQGWTGRPGSPEMLTSAARSMDDGLTDQEQTLVRKSHDIELGTMARLGKVQRKLESVNALNSLLVPDHPLGLPRVHDPKFDSSMNRTGDSTLNASCWYNQLPSSDTDTKAFLSAGANRESNLPPSLFSPHADSLLQTSITKQQFVADAQYQGMGGHRPDFSALGTRGSLLATSNLGYTGKPLTLTIKTVQGKPEISFHTSSIGVDHPEVVALYDYQAQRSDELTFTRRDVIKVLYKDNENWWMGEMNSGKQGFFPANYVTSQTKDKTKCDSDEELLNEFRTEKQKGESTGDELDEMHLKERMAAIISRSGDLKIFSASATESDAEGITAKKVRRKKKGKAGASVLVENETASPTRKTSSLRKKKKNAMPKDSEA